MRYVEFNIDYRMMTNGCAPLFVVDKGPDGLAVGYLDIEDWGFSNNLVVKLHRLNELLDKTINWDDPKDETWEITEVERAEYVVLFPIVIEQLRRELGPEWLLTVRSRGRL